MAGDLEVLGGAGRWRAWGDSNNQSYCYQPCSLTLSSNVVANIPGKRPGVERNIDTTLRLSHFAPWVIR